MASTRRPNPPLIGASVVAGGHTLAEIALLVRHRTGHGDCTSPWPSTFGRVGLQPVQTMSKSLGRVGLAYRRDARRAAYSGATVASAEGAIPFGGPRVQAGAHGRPPPHRPAAFPMALRKSR